MEKGLIEVSKNMFYKKVETCRNELFFTSEPLQFKLEYNGSIGSVATVGLKTNFLTKTKGLIGVLVDWPRKKYYLKKRIKRVLK